MTKSTRNQQSFTEGFLTAAGRSSSEYPQYIKAWWWNHTDPNNLRLSKSGLDFLLKFTDILIYECKLSEPLKNRSLIQLSRFLNCPYYIVKLDKIFLLGEEETIMLKLHADNMQQYLDNLQFS